MEFFLGNAFKMYFCFFLKPSAEIQIEGYARKFIFHALDSSCTEC